MQGLTLCLGSALDSSLPSYTSHITGITDMILCSQQTNKKSVPLFNQLLDMGYLRFILPLSHLFLLVLTWLTLMTHM
jgi:hypothetical protein